MSGNKKEYRQNCTYKGKRNIKVVKESAEQYFVEKYNLFNMKSADQCKPYMVMLKGK